ncbi:MAG: penicillin-binding protein activator [Patescibacteria group bacterium]
MSNYTFKNTATVLVIIGIVVGGLLYFTSNTAPANPAKIGVLIPLTGKFANLGEDVRNGLELAKGDIKNRTGLDLELVYEDSAADPKVSVMAATKLVNLDKVDVIIAGPGSSANLAALPVLEKAPNGQPVFIVISSTPKLNTAGRYVVKAQHDIDLEALAAAKYLFAQGFRSASVMYDSTSDTLSTGRDVFSKQFRELGGAVVAIEGYDGKGVMDFKTQLTKLKASRPDVLYFLAVDKIAGPLVKQTRSIGLSQPIFGFAALESEEFLKGAGDAAEGVSFTALPFSCGGNSEMKKYCELYSTNYNNRIPISYGAYGYDILSIVGEVVEKTGDLDREKIVEAFEGREYQGVSGVLVFDNNGNIQIPDFPIRTVENGKFVDLK